MAAEALISVEGASKKFCSDLNRSLRYAFSDSLRQMLALRAGACELRPSEFWALNEISFSMGRGESIAVLGVNGAGKSTLLKLLMGSLRPTEGRIVTHGRIAALTEMGLGFDPILTGRENALLSAAVLGIDRRRVQENLDEIVEFAGLQSFIDSPLQIYSSGMRARLGFSVAMYMDPDILLVDEVLAVGDVGFQRKCVQHAKRFLARGGSLVLVTHSTHLAQALCQRCIVIDHGRVVFDGSSVEGVSRYFELVQQGEAGSEEGTKTEVSDYVSALGSSPRAADEAEEAEACAEAADEISAEPAVAAAAEAPEAPQAVTVGGETCGEEALVMLDQRMEALTVGELRTGEPARIRIHYRALEPQLVRWGFTVWTPSRDQAVFTCMNGMEVPVELPAGEGELVCELERLPLAAGRFAVGFGILDFDSSWPLASHGYPENDDLEPQIFEVSQPASFVGNIQQNTGALVVADGLRWHEPRLRDAGEHREEGLRVRSS